MNSSSEESSDFALVAESLVPAEAEAAPVEPASEEAAAEPNSRPTQGEMPFAMVHGKAYTQLPQDLYIPPDALEVFLEAFEGPLDLLLSLVRKNDFNIHDIPIAAITRQYLDYMDEAHALDLNQGRG